MPNGDDLKERLRKLKARWKQAVGTYPTLLEEFPKEPWDDQGNFDPRALEAYKQKSEEKTRYATPPTHITESSRQRVLTQRPPMSSFGTPDYYKGLAGVQLPEIEYQAAPLTPHRPKPIWIDPETVPDAPSYWDPGVWAERAQKIARGTESFGPSGLVKSLLKGDMGRRITRGAEAIGDVPPDAPWYSRPAAGFGAIYKPELEAAAAVGETTAPVRGAATIWGTHGLVEEEVRQGYDIYRAQGLDPVSAMAAAYNRAEASPGEISGFKKFLLYALTDPIELLPGGMLASLSRRAATSAAGAGVKTAASLGKKLPEALPPAARAADEAVPGVVGTAGAEIDNIISRVPETSVNATPYGKKKAAESVERHFEELLTGEKVKGRTGHIKYITRQTGQSPDDVENLIARRLDEMVSESEGTYIGMQKKAAVAQAQQRQDPDSWIKFKEDWFDQFWGIKGLQTGIGMKRRILPKRKGVEKYIEPGGELDISGMLARYPGDSARGILRSNWAIEHMKGIAKTSIKNDTFYDDVNKYVQAMHGLEVFAAKKGTRKAFGEFQSPSQINALLRGLQQQLGPTGYAELQSAAAAVPKLYADDLQRYVAKGMVTKEDAAIMISKYPWYNPTRYVEWIDSAEASGKISQRGVVGRSATNAPSPIRALSDEGIEEAIKPPLENLTTELIRNSKRVAQNDIKRAVITLALRAGTAGVKKSTKSKLVAVTKKDEKVFRPITDAENMVSFFDPKQPGIRQSYDVPEYIYREIEFLESSYRPRNIVSGVNSFVKGGLTTYNPVFAVTNILNDTLTAGLTRGVLPHEVARELKTTLTAMDTDPFIQVLTLAGGRQRRFYGKSVEQLAEEAGAFGVESGRMKTFFREISGKEPWSEKDLMERIRASGGQPGTAKEVTGKIKQYTYGWIPELGEAGELAPRIAAAKKELRKLDPDLMKRFDSGDIRQEEFLEIANMPAMKAVVESGLEATVNFGRGGRKIKWANQYFLFLNAAMEGMKLPVRAAQRNPKLFGTTISSAILGQAGLTTYNMQNPEYWNIPAWERWGSILVMLPWDGKKDTYGNPIPNRVNLTPRTREWAAFLSTTTYIMERLVGNNPASLLTFIKTLIPQVTPVSGIPLPEIANIPTEQIAQYDFFRSKPIVREHMKNQPPSEQYETWTSPSLKALANSVDDQSIPGVFKSPVRLEHLFNSVFGGAGKEALSGADLIYRIIENWREEDTPKETQRLAEEYKGLTTYTERKDLESRMDPKTRKDVIEEARKPEIDISAIPIVGGISRRISPPYSGEKYAVSKEIAEKTSGISADQTQQASNLLSEYSETKLDEQLRADTTIDLTDISYEGISNRIRWREANSDRERGYGSVLDVVIKKYPMSAQAADPESRNAYYETLATAGGAYPDMRTRGQVLKAGYYSIQPSDDDLTEDEKALGITNMDRTYEERQNYMDSLGEDDLRSLKAELEASKTETERQYDSDMEKIRELGYWDIYPILTKGTGVFENWEVYKSKRGRARTNYLNSPESGNLRKVLNEASNIRDALRRNNSELEDLLEFWGIITKPIEEKSGPTKADYGVQKYRR
jgi:hypothetical protein